MTPQNGVSHFFEDHPLNLTGFLQQIGSFLKTFRKRCLAPGLAAVDEHDLFRRCIA